MNAFLVYVSQSAGAFNIGPGYGETWVIRVVTGAPVKAIAPDLISANNGRFRVVVYNDNYPLPGSQVFLSPELLADATGLKIVPVSPNLAPGAYWFGIHQVDAGASITVRGTNTPNPAHPGNASPSRVSDTFPLNAYKMTGGGATPPTSWPGTGTVEIMAMTLSLQGA